MHLCLYDTGVLHVVSDLANTPSRAAREADEMAALDAVGDYEADPNVMLEAVPQDIVIKTLKMSCACVPVLVLVCVCVCACARRRYVFVRICI